ncbi:hypothetical protein L7F22_034413 [Adiantum nelumboides]|nr:hypothetical protein [Adiantum nelumboides]
MTRWAEAASVDRITAADVSKFVFDYICSRFGTPLDILSDRGPSFRADLLDALLKNLSIKHVHSTPYYPQCNGLVEKTNGVLCKIITKHVRDRPQDWDKHLTAALWAYRTSFKVSPQFTPYHLVYGQEALLPIEVELGSLRVLARETTSSKEKLEQRILDLQRLELDRETATDYYIIQANKKREQFNNKVKEKKLDEGMLVMSRALADFFGEHSMLAVVCKTSEAAGLLVRLNESDGSIDDTCGLYDYIKRQKQNIHEKLRIFILENMRLYIEGLEESDLQKLLKLVQCKLIDGFVSRGFLGYAVNFMQLNEEHGGLRESPFYSLLKELQVYDARRNLFSAKSALTAGGTSLDGSMVQERGCEDFGQWQKPKILFLLRSRNIHSGTIPPLRSINKIT